MNRIAVFDIETNGLRPDVIHCLSATIYTPGQGYKIKSTTDYNVMRKFFSSNDVIAGHNIIRYDIPVVEKLLDIKVECQVIDTLPLSWCLYNERPSHGLAKWGDSLGFEKPVVDDWENGEEEEYIARCEADVEINTRLLDKQIDRLDNLYEGDQKKILSVINYFNMVLRVHRNIEENPFTLDVDYVKSSLAELTILREEKEEALQKAMPFNKKTAKRRKPKVMKKKNGELSAMGVKWYQLLDEQGLPHDHDEVVEVVVSEELGNPGSGKQVKDWLFELGWKPETFTYTKQDDGSVKSIPQISKNIAGEKIVCDSIKSLYEKAPALELLGGMSVLTHRIGILKGFLRDEYEGTLSSEIVGMTPTFRVRHAQVVNLPKVSLPYGDMIRGALIAPEGKMIVGSDLNSLENMIGLHFAKFIDQDYVDRILQPGYDAHLFMAVFSGVLEEEKSDLYKELKKKKSLTKEEDHEFHEIDMIRQDSKQVNYSAQYGIGAKSLSKNMKKPIKYAKNLINSYWKLHEPLNKVTQNIVTKVCYGKTWMLNPITNIWMELRSEKDILNLLIQGTGSFITYTWAHFCIERGLDLSLVYHDEVAAIVDIDNTDHESILNESIEKVNQIFNFDPEMAVDVKTGSSYAEVH